MYESNKWAWAVVITLVLLVQSASAASPSKAFLAKIPAGANYSEFAWSQGAYSYLPVGASYFSPIGGYAQYGLKAVNGKVLVATWRFPKNKVLLCQKNSWIQGMALANLYDYSGVCN